VAENTEAKGLLGVWTDSDPALEAAFNEWYNREHVNERADNPGFKGGRRYRSLSSSGKPRYMAMYPIEDVSVLSAPHYKKAQAKPTSGTRKMMPAFLNIIRSEFIIRHRVGRGYGATVIAVRREGRGLPDPKFGKWLGSKALKAILKEPGVTSAMYLETENQTEPEVTKESSMRPTPDRIADWALYIEGTEPALVRAAFEKIMPRSEMQKRGVGPNLRIGTYKFLYGTEPVPGN